MFGCAVLDSWSGRHDITALVGRTRVTAPGVTSVRGDLREPSGLHQLVMAARPEIVLHCAAWTDLDACEENPRTSHTVHCDATASLARGAAAVGAKFIYISTDAVFGGTPGPHRECDPVNPLSVYAKTKLEGERIALELCPSGLVVRTCIVGWNAQRKISLLEWILRELRGGRSINAFSDVSFTPIGTIALSGAVEQLLDVGANGVVHVGGAACVSKYDFARRVADEFSLPPELVVAASIKTASLRAPRPLSPCLDSSRFAKLTGATLQTVEETLREMRRLEASGWPEHLRSLVQE
jgi:dTDP-4-dehydrorhamnose reductase